MLEGRRRIYATRRALEYVRLRGDAVLSPGMPLYSVDQSCVARGPHAGRTDRAFHRQLVRGSPRRDGPDAIRHGRTTMGTVPAVVVNRARQYGRHGDDDAERHEGYAYNDPHGGLPKRSRAHPPVTVSAAEDQDLIGTLLTALPVNHGSKR